MKNDAHNGFTLIEVLIVTGIIAVMLSVAVPSYQRYIDRASRNDARIGLLKLAADQQSHFLRSGSYAADLTELGRSQSSTVTANGRYRLSVISASAEGFVVRAALISPERERALCAWMEMDQRQHKWAGPAGSRECWFR